MRLFSAEEREASGRQAVPAGVIASTRSRLAMEGWVQTGEVDLLASQVVVDGELVTYAHPLPEDASS